MDDLKSKIFELIKEKQPMPVATLTDEDKPWVRYAVAVGSEDLSIRFATSLKTRKIAQLQRNPEVHMTCGAAALETTGSYLQIAGKAEITTDKDEKDRLWTETLKAYFSGPDDPNYCVVIVRPYRIELMSLTEMQPLVWEAD